VVRVSTPEAAELTKLLENIFRSVNIALMNEMAMLCDRMGIDVWEVADAAATKPFGFMSFKPGPGLGGHCLPLDPFYLAWKAREYDFYTEFIELAGKVNENMPYFCLAKINRALNRREKSLSGARVLVLGVAYKNDIDDTRESPALKLIELLQGEGADVQYHDAHVESLRGLDLRSVPLDDDTLRSADCVAIVTAHSSVDYAHVVDVAPLVVDFRNATGAQGASSEHVWKL
jgi:UDP-N-acetyl-D-glucosamine dehydrogenase